jgi:hypothetical protein
MAKFIHVALKLPSSVFELLAFARHVLTLMTGNPKFASASSALVTLSQRISEMEAALAQGTAAQRRAAREALRETLAHLGNQVQSVAETQAGTPDLLAIAALVESAGMKLRKVGGHPKLVFAAKWGSVPGSVPGSVHLTAPASLERDTHEWQVSTDQLTWKALPGTRQAKTQVDGLPVGVTHYFRHRLLTKDGYSEWSDPTLVLVVR